MKINIILPFMAQNAVGGIKIMYQYADYLAERGHEVILYHTAILKNAPKKYLNPLRFARFKLCVKDSYPKWFEFKNAVDSKLVNEISDKTIENGDVVLSTMYATALDVFALHNSKGKKINVIQDFETWITDEETLIKSYQLPITHVVINDYLYSIVEKYSPIKPVLIYNAIDSERFFLKKAINSRFPHSVCMMYSEEGRKGTKYGIEALNKCKIEIPDLKATFFSVFPRPSSLPEWIEFHQSPNHLIDIYNNAAIFLTPSLGEGWALPPAEAMMCGCALVCTDIGGHGAYALNNKTALTIEPENSVDAAEKLLLLLRDNELRMRLATDGHAFIQSFTWEKVLQKLEETFNN